jgi:hypothetical protein
VIRWIIVALAVVLISLGAFLWATGRPKPGVPVALGGGLLAVGSYVYDQLRPSKRVADFKAKRELDEIREEVKAEQERERLEREVEERRRAQLRDLDKIREAIVQELGRLAPGNWLTFGWGRTAGDQEMHRYSLVEGKLELDFEDQTGRTSWRWETGEFPHRHDANSDIADARLVQRAYDAIQPERYLLYITGERLELPDPGYKRYGVNAET